MNRKKFLPAAIVVMFLVQAVLVSGVSAPRPPKAEWTYMLFIDADNEFGPIWLNDNLPELESAGSTDAVNFVALVDFLDTNTCELIYIEQGTHTVIETWPEQDMGSPDTLVNFINTVTTLYPAKKNLLQLWNHGDGWKWFNLDVTSASWMTMPEFGQALEMADFCFDIIAFDGCDLAVVDVAYQIRDYADYMVASEETVPEYGFPYDLNARDLVDNPTWDARTYAAEMVNNWAEFYDTLGGWMENWSTLSATDIGQMSTFTTAFTDMASVMLADLPQYKRDYGHAVKASQQMWGTHFYLDLYDFAKVLLEDRTVTDPVLRQALQDVQTAITSMVIAYDNGIKNKKCRGLTFYFASSREWGGSWNVREDYLEIAFAQVTGWITFLDAYYGVEA